MAACGFIKSQMSVDSCVFTAAVQCLRLRVHCGRLQVYPRSAAGAAFDSHCAELE